MTTAPPKTTTNPTVNPDVLAAIDSAVADAFATYLDTWALRRRAFQDPSNADLRAELINAYAPERVGSLLASLDRLVETGRASGEPNDELQRVELVRSVAGGEGGGVAVFTVCETLTAPILDGATGTPTYEGSDSYRAEVTMFEVDGRWIVQSDIATDEFVGTECD